MPFSDAFSVANPFSVNPQYSNTPQAAQAKKMKAASLQAQTPEHAFGIEYATHNCSAGI